MKKPTKLTVIIPAYNEERVIKSTLERVYRFLSKKNYTWKIIVVDDGSRDKTPDIVKAFKRGVGFIRLGKNQGKGAAIRAGIKKSNSEFIIFTDADLSVPIDFIDKFVKELQKGSDVVIGSRRTTGSKVLIHQSKIREALGRVFTVLAKAVTGSRVSDFTCGFKGFNEKAAEGIFSRTLLDRWAYDAEIIFLAKRGGLGVTEIPVQWKNKPDTKVVLGNAVVTSLVDLLKIRLNDILGKYDHKA